jgi:hypothetical protein
VHVRKVPDRGVPEIRSYSDRVRQPSGYAVVFGFSPHAFTQAVDGAAKKLDGS